MEKIAFDFQDKCHLYTTSIPVLVNHLNYGNHLGYDAVLSIIQEARMQFLKQHNMSEVDINNAVGYLITDVAVSYKTEAFHSDILKIEIFSCDIKKYSFDLQYRITNNINEKIIALCKTGHVFYDFQNKKIAQMPQNFYPLMNKHH